MVIEFFRSPFDTPLMFDGDRIISVTQKGMGGKGMK
jgi:hypothetical protein